MTSDVHQLIQALFNWLLDPAMRTFYAYWPLTLLIALGWAGLNWQQRKGQVQQLGKRAFWFNPSTYQDYVLIIFNRLLFLVLGITWLFVTMKISLYVFAGWKLLGSPTEPFSYGNTTLIVGCYTLALFLLDDASRFALHAIMHKSDWLWRIHQVHHSATTLTPLSTLRLHPLESLLYQTRGSLVHGLAAGTAFFFLGFHPDSWQIWGASIWILIFNALGANLRHSPIKMSYGRLEKIFISPSQHQAHHGVTTMNKNFGSILSIWDRMAGSWRSGKEDYKWPQRAQPLWKQLLLKEIDWK